MLESLPVFCGPWMRSWNGLQKYKYYNKKIFVSEVMICSFIMNHLVVPARHVRALGGCLYYGSALSLHFILVEEPWSIGRHGETDLSLAWTQSGLSFDVHFILLWQQVKTSFTYNQTASSYPDSHKETTLCVYVHTTKILPWKYFHFDFENSVKYLLLCDF